MNTFKERLAYLWQNEAKQAKIAADIDMTIAGFSRIWHEGGLPKAETLKKIKQLKASIYRFQWLEIAALAALVQRTMEISVTISSDSAYVATELGECEVSWETLQAS